MIHYASAQGQLDGQATHRRRSGRHLLTSAGCTPAGRAAAAHPKQRGRRPALIAEGVDIDARTEDGLTALYTAATILAADRSKSSSAIQPQRYINADGGGPTSWSTRRTRV